AEPEPAKAPDLPMLDITSAAVDGADAAPAADAGALLGLEPTSFTDAIPAEPEPMDAQAFDEIDLSAIPEARTEREPGANDLALGGELPEIVAAPRVSGSLIEIAIEEGESPAVELPMIDTVPDAESLGLEPTVIDAPADATDIGIINVEEAEAHRPAAVTGEIEAVVPEAPTQFGEVESAVVEEPPPPVRRSSAMMAANSVLTLRIKVEDEPENWGLRRQLGEALLDAGERDEGMRELESALAGFDKANDIDSASSIADEIVRLDPSSVRYHQKRVEYAFRSNDKGRTADAYLALADALLRNGQAERARTVYQRVLELVPGNPSAQAALESLLPAPEPAAPGGSRPATPPRGKRYTGAVEPVKDKAPEPVPGSDDDFVSLGDWLREDEGPKNTRMVVEEQEPTGDEQADFADMLKKFKQGISENVEEEDHEAHYDLGVAYKEMGLVDEAIAEFQKALRGTQHRARTYEALGQCFLEKKQLPVATTILKRALSEPGIGDEQLVGVLYLLGYIHEAQGKPADAKGFYERVFAVDIQFRDVGDRLNAVDKALK
ncbi:MAG TPA: tetratricopeptide repeat protein, partial [Gemmatimonadaceae bacterium]|nr:tetratricopeptide repeat protein [Gemmatimonadaceae bacterium]